LDRRFLTIAALTTLLGSISMIFTVGYFFFGWGGQYRYELFYFPSPVVYTLDSLTTTGRMLSFVMPVVAFLTLLLMAQIVRIPSSKMLSTGAPYPNGVLPGSLELKQYSTGILVASVGRELDSATQPSFASGFLSRLFPYDRDQSEAPEGHIDTHLIIGAEKTTIVKGHARGVAHIINKNIT